MHVYTPNGSVMIIANSPEHADQVYKRVMGIPEEFGTGLTWTEVPDNQVIEAWQIRQQTAEAWVQQLGVAEGVQLCLGPEGGTRPLTRPLRSRDKNRGGIHDRFRARSEEAGET